ncbi:MAG: hypothetical protein KN64_08880 [Sulfurovum sp. AS07-7]|nr:MAG: hypothetical protein KN64_08880 [Sulfurovum sp. AS07-7]
MRIFLSLVFLSSLLFSNEFSIASYNVENLFDAKYQGSEYDDYIPGKHNWNVFFFCSYFTLSFIV